MPYWMEKIRKGKHKGKVRVKSPHGTKAKHTTLAKAIRQKRLLQAKAHDY